MAQLSKGHGLGMVAAGPNAVELSGGDSYRPRVGKRIFLIDRTEYLIPADGGTVEKGRLRRRLV
ncbi:hypothetical protein [Pyramidobacter sp. C12-8]|uniref:hypothetical protein n=1 Tax=Pyramidobacter sp. C12-8 TaxID=1943580 RepID=UPI00117B870A|nr:hypothetical protein [Pyramidobacter sp. C12-8]